MVVEAFGTFLLHVGAVLGALLGMGFLAKRLLREHDRRVRVDSSRRWETRREV